MAVHINQQTYPSRYTEMWAIAHIKLSETTYIHLLRHSSTSMIFRYFPKFNRSQLHSTTSGGGFLSHGGTPRGTPSYHPCLIGIFHVWSTLHRRRCLVRLGPVLRISGQSPGLFSDRTSTVSTGGFRGIYVWWSLSRWRFLITIILGQY